MFDRIGPFYGKLAQLALTKLSEENHKRADQFELTRLYNKWDKLSFADVSYILDKEIPCWRSEFKVSKEPLGSASIAHSAVKTEEPISEGIVALLEPFVDTVVICSLTAFVIIFTGYHNPELAQGLDGAQLTSKAFGSVFSWFPYVLVVAIMLFAFSTMISWSYYGLKGFDYLFGKLIERLTGKRELTKYVYFTIFLFFTVVGSASSMGAVMDFSDMMILSMAFPNIIGLLILSPEVYRDLKSYLSRVKSGAIKKYK